jgi:FAD:protein FMN transferase
MGCEVVVEGASSPALDRIRATFEGYDATFSRFRVGSELLRVNARGGGLVSPLFARTLDTALWAARATGGLVDPTIAAALVATGYERDFSDGLDAAAPAGTAPVAGWRAIRLVGRVVTLASGASLDLNGVVKALAVDEAAALLEGDGFVSAGGDLATRGAVDVALPAGGPVRVDGGIATSGTTRRRWLRAGELQHHLVDPRTGRPARSRWEQVTVVGATCLAADVAAKAALLLSGDGPAWLDERALPGRFVAGDEVVESAAWRRALEPACT